MSWCIANNYVWVLLDVNFEFDVAFVYLKAWLIRNQIVKFKKMFQETLSSKVSLFAFHGVTLCNLVKV